MSRLQRTNPDRGIRSFIRDAGCTYPLRRLLPVLCLLMVLATLLMPSAASAQADALRIHAGEQVQGDVATTGRDIVVEGEVLGDVTSWSGTITIVGHVTGDVVSYTGVIVLNTGARVDGHVLALASGVTQAPGARVAGQLIRNEPAGAGAVSSLVDLFTESQSGIGSTLARMLLSTTLSLIALLLATAIALRWPRRTEGAGRMLLFTPWRSLALGLLTTLLLVALLVPLSALLAMTLVGLPLILGLVVILQLPYIYGLAALGQVIGRSLWRISLQQATPFTTAAGVLLLLVPLAVLGTLSPAWSVVLFYTFASAGLGAVILSRGGAFAPYPDRVTG